MKGADVALEAWDIGAKVLIGEIDRNCQQAFWAQPAATAAPDTDGGEPADAALRARALAQLRKTAAWKEIQKSYLESDPRPAAGTRWDDDAGTVEVQRFRARRGGKEIHLVSVNESVGGGCGEFGGDLWGLYEEQGGKLIPRNAPGKTAVKPLSVVDSDSDGNSELLYKMGTFNFGTDKGRVLFDGELWDRIEEVTVPFMDCPC